VDEYLSEKEQWERITSTLKAYAPWALAGVAVALLGVGGWRWWQARGERLALDASAQYEQVLSAFTRGDRTQGLALIDRLQREHPGSPYIDQANLAAARLFVEANELDRAAQRLSSVVAESRDRQLVTIVRLRLARVQISLGKPDQALATLGAQPGASFAAPYHEVRGDAYFAKSDHAAALAEYRAAQAAQPGGVAGNSSLRLKINDLSQDSSTPPSAAAHTNAPAGAGK
jgi:predicted negative regulator of RcsB-dependent stress response